MEEVIIVANKKKAEEEVIVAEEKKKKKPSLFDFWPSSAKTATNDYASFFSSSTMFIVSAVVVAVAPWYSWQQQLLLLQEQQQQQPLIITPPWPTVLNFLAMSLLIIVEVVFYLVYRLYLVPRANDFPITERNKAVSYRDYPRVDQRHLLLEKILDRIERNSKLDYSDEEAKDAMRDETRAFLLQWFNNQNDDDQDNRRPNITTEEGNDGSPPSKPLLWLLPTLNKSPPQPPSPSPEMIAAAENDERRSKGGGGGEATTSCGSSSFIKEVRRLIRRLPSGEMYFSMPSPPQVLLSRAPPSRAVSSFMESEFENSSSYEEEEESDTSAAAESKDDDDDEEVEAVTLITTTSGSTDKNKVYEETTATATTTANTNTTACSSTTNTNTISAQWTIEGLCRHNANEFFSWAFFEKNYCDMSEEETDELNKIYQIIERRCYGLVFPPHEPSATTTTGTTTASTIRPPPPPLQPRRLSLENLLSTRHRPLMVYLVVIVLQAVAAFLLKHVLGFERVISPSTGLKAWYYNPGGQYQNNIEATTSNSTKPEEDDNNNDPILFFHGIAPAGYVFYLPMVLYLSSSVKDNKSTSWFGFWRRKRRKRPLILFENPNISCRIGFKALSEIETVRGVEEIVHMTLSSCPANNKKKDLVLIGHSFGSCPLTWLLHSSSVKLKSRIKRVVLIDPVTILLSEPDVMNNFLYSSPYDASRRRIRTVASSELFTEYYLRRHFAWYNSELWVSLAHSQQQQDNVVDSDDDSINCSANNAGIIEIVVALSGRDEIVNSQKVYRELEQQLLNQSEEQIQRSTANATTTTTTTSHEHFDNNVNQLQLQRVLYWDQSRHAECVSSPTKWEELRQHGMAL